MARNWNRTEDRRPVCVVRWVKFRFGKLLRTKLPLATSKGRAPSAGVVSVMLRCTIVDWWEHFHGQDLLISRWVPGA